MGQCQDRLNSVLSNLSSIYENYLYLKNYYEYLEIKPIIYSDKCRKSIIDIKQGIKIDNLSFKYPGTDRYAVKGINIDIKNGESIALVGNNGAGKTTLIKLISRLYDPDEGNIYVDGQNLKEIDCTEYQKMIGIVFQDYGKYHFEAKENIGFGSICDIKNETMITKAANISGAHELISRLPKGYASTLGRYFDDGCQLSVGEWQKVAVARAFMGNSKIIILDEPSASMDTTTEYELFKNIKEYTGKKISIIISHRFSNVRIADRIVVLDKGEIAEIGSHEELMRADGNYKKMFIMQAERYFSTGQELRK